MFEYHRGRARDKGHHGSTVEQKRVTGAAADWEPVKYAALASATRVLESQAC